MKDKKISFFCLVAIILILASKGFGFYLTKAEDLDSYALYRNKGLKITLNADTGQYKNFYGISWRGNPKENLIYARQMGYKYVFYQPGMEEDSLSDGLSFTDGYFRETVTQRNEIIYSSGKLKLKSADYIGKGYIINLKTN